MKTPVFVTGGTGLIGAHLISRLLEDGVAVRALKRPNSNLEIVKKILGYYHADAADAFRRIQWVDGSLHAPESLHDAIGDAREVYHFAGMVSFDPRERKQLFDANVGGTAAIVDFCLQAGVKKLCYMSSASTLGKPTGGSDAAHIDEETPWNPSREDSDYALSKYHAEQEVWKGIEKGLQAVILNPTIVIGPGDWDRSSSKLISTIWKGFPFYSAGANAFVDVRDVANTAVGLMKSGRSGERFVVTGENLPFKALFDAIADHLQVKRPAIPVNPLLGGLAWRAAWLHSKLSGKAPQITRATVAAARKRYVFSNQKIVQALDYSFMPIEQSVRDTCKIFLEENHRL